MMHIKHVLKLFPAISSLVIAICSCGSGIETAPVISSISTDYIGNMAVAGKPVTLNGSNFSAVASENKVLCGIGLDAVSVGVTESAPDHLVFIAPDIAAKHVVIRVSTKGIESNSVNLEYTDSDEPWSDIPTLELPGATTVTIRPGVEWTSFHGVWEGQVRNINIVRTTLNEHNKLGIFHDYNTSGNLINLDQKCEHMDALVGTNGPMQCCHFVRVDGVIQRVANDQDYIKVNSALTIDGDVVDIVRVKDNYDAAKLPNRTVGCAGPMLVWEGKIQTYPEDNTDDFLKTTHPRTAIGLSSDGKTVIQVAVDGRYSSSDSKKTAVGLPTPLLSKLMKGLGCYKAMNFDGGGGTAMWIYGQGDKGIVNHPCDNNDWDSPQKSLRATGNAVFVKSDLK